MTFPHEKKNKAWHLSLTALDERLVQQWDSDRQQVHLLAPGGPLHCYQKVLPVTFQDSFLEALASPNF